jgi:glycosyltransferase involved in cell wall biosynthesis
VTTPKSAVFALPGDITTLTGGYIYDRRLVAGLRDQGREIQVVSLPDTFPTPDTAQMQTAMAQLLALPSDVPVIIDGLAFGALDTDALQDMRAPIIAMIHHPLAQESALPADLADHLWRTERENLRMARHILVPSPHTKQMLVNRYDVTPDRITIARPGTLAKPVGDVAVPSSPPLILSVGILHPRKGHDVLIAALGKLTDLDWQAVIVGNPRDEAHVRHLTDLIATSGLEKKLRLAGKVSDDELAALYGKASIFALATRYEGYGIVFDEALSHGLPIVSTRTGAVPDTVPKDAGLLVAADDAPAFADALRQFLTDPQMRATYATAAAKAGAALPDWAETAQVAGQVIDNL